MIQFFDGIKDHEAGIDFKVSDILLFTLVLFLFTRETLTGILAVAVRCNFCTAQPVCYDEQKATRHNLLISV